LLRRDQDLWPILETAVALDTEARMGSRFVFALAVVGVALVAATASGCGGASAEQKQVRAEAAQRAARVAAYRRCRAQTGRFLTVLEDLDSRLDVGLSLQAYGDRLGDVKVAADSLPPGLRYACRKRVGVPAADALTAYLYAYKTWDECLNKFDYCVVQGETESMLQTFWTAAHKRIRTAETGLAQLGEGT
jgi:hypothetical protein